MKLKRTNHTNEVTETTEALNAQQAMVLMEIEEMIEEDAVGLSRNLNMSVGRLVQIAADLQKKGLVIVKRVSGELYLSLSKKGKRLYSSLWPQQLYGQV
jgi:DNA-binding MarR family transcriptional regulator